MLKFLKPFKLKYLYLASAVIVLSAVMAPNIVQADSIPEFPAYEVVNDNVPYFTDKEKINTNAFESYSKLDNLGRCGVAYANVCKEIMPTEERQAIGKVKPTGWHTVKYNDIIDGNYLYNRCHLIGFQLAGENANKKNLITGTRYMNVDGMLPFENQVDDYIEMYSNNHVLYRVTPVFEGGNLLASGVLMEAYSVEDQGAGVQFCVYCPNVQPGILINYSDGSSSIDENYTGETTKDRASSIKNSSTQEIASASKQKSSEVSKKTNSNAKATTVIASDFTGSKYILNTNTKKVHLSSCRYVSQINTENAEGSNSSPDKLKSDGYTACGVCDPFGITKTTSKKNDSVTKKDSSSNKNSSAKQSDVGQKSESAKQDNSTKESGSNKTVEKAQQKVETQASQPVSGGVWLSKSGSKYHSKNNCGKMNPSTATQTTEADAIARGYGRCSKCW